MEQRGFRFGDWQVEVGGNSLSNGDARAALEPRVMDVLRYLCRHPGAVIPAEELLQACWGTSELGDNPIHKAIAQLRRALGDSSTEPRYIETVRKRGYRAIADVVEEEEQAGIWQDGSPFRGLEAFEESHAAIFFGRVQTTARLRHTVLKQIANGCAMTLVLGPSGSGKTSLVRAGLLPQLTGGDGSVALACLLHMDCADLGGSGLFGALAAVLMDAELDGALRFQGSSAETLGERLRSDPAAVAIELAGGAERGRCALFVDRLEAIFRAPDTTHDDRVRFIQALDRLASHGTLVILACRNDFYPDLIALPELMALKARGGHFDLEPPDGADVAQMVRQPARAAHLTFEHDPVTGANLDDVLCDAARASADALPLLQYCLNELYRQRGDDGLLRFDVFHQLGGIEGALGVRAEQVVAALPAARQAALPHVLSLLVSVGEEKTAVTARRAPWSALRNDAERELVHALVEARLFVTELAGEVPSFGVAHEALLRRWPRVAEWIEQHREALQVRTRIAAQAERWAAGGRPRDLLLPSGTQVNQGRDLLAAKSVALSGLEEDYVRRSVTRARLGERIRIGVMTLIALLAVLAGVLGVRARVAQHDAEQHRLEAEGLMGFMLGDFVGRLRPLGRLDLLDSVSSKALSYLSTGGDRGDATARLQRVKTLHVIAEVGMARGNTQSALDALIAARALLAPDGKVPEDTALLAELGINAFYRGRIDFDKKDYDRAEPHFREYLEFSEQLARRAVSAENWNQVASAHNTLGAMAKRRGQRQQAEQHFASSAELNRRAMAAAPSDRTYQGALANSLSWLGDARAALGQTALASQCYSEESTLLEALQRAAPEELLWTSRLVYSLWHQGDTELEQGQRATAQASFARARKLLATLTERDPSNQRWQVDLMRVRVREIDAQERAREHIEQFETMYARSMAMSEAAPGNTELSSLTEQLKSRLTKARSWLASK